MIAIAALATMVVFCALYLIFLYRLARLALKDRR